MRKFHRDAETIKLEALNNKQVDEFTINSNIQPVQRRKPPFITQSL